MDDLRETILYVLLFSEQIFSVELVYHVDGAVQKIRFQRGAHQQLAGYRELPQYQPLEQKLDASLWNHTSIGILQEIVQDIYSQGTLQEVKAHFPKVGEFQIYDWLNAVIRQSERYIYNFTGKIYPDQNGRLHFLSELSKDCISHGQLKEIAQGLSI